MRCAARRSCGRPSARGTTTDRRRPESLIYLHEDIDWVIEKMAQGAFPVAEFATVLPLDEIATHGIAAMHDQSAFKVVADLDNVPL